MNIDAINAGNFRQPNFKGLSRTVERVEDNTRYESAYETEIGTITRYRTIYYYPFALEKEKEIQEFVKKNTYTSESPTIDPVDRIFVSSVEVQKPLSMTKKDYDNYLESMRVAKGIYDEKINTARRNAIKSLAPAFVEPFEKELKENGLVDSLAKI